MVTSSFDDGLSGIRWLVIVGLVCLLLCLCLLVYLLATVHASERSTTDRLMRLEKRTDDIWAVQEMEASEVRALKKELENVKWWMRTVREEEEAEPAEPGGD